MSATCDELNAMPTAEGYDKVYYPGERAVMRKKKAYEAGGIEIVDSIYKYLKSDDIHYNRYDHKKQICRIGEIRRMLKTVVKKWAVTMTRLY